jgi:hypothetical protein
MTASIHPHARGSVRKRGAKARDGRPPSPIRDEDRAFGARPRPHGGGEGLREHQDRLLDEGIEETFPASDPVSVPRVEGA